MLQQRAQKREGSVETLSDSRIRIRDLGDYWPSNRIWVRFSSRRSLVRKNNYYWGWELYLSSSILFVRLLKCRWTWRRRNSKTTPLRDSTVISTTWSVTREITRGGSTTPKSKNTGTVRDLLSGWFQPSFVGYSRDSYPRTPARQTAYRGPTPVGVSSG